MPHPAGNAREEMSTRLGSKAYVALARLWSKAYKSLAWLRTNVLRPLFYLGIVIVFVATAMVVVPKIIIRLVPESRLGYAFEYFVAPEKVDVEPKPHDCEFMNAPVGNKSCHFEKEVDVVRNERGEVTNVIVTWNKVQE